jgi:hypothetical protein
MARLGRRVPNRPIISSPSKSSKYAAAPPAIGGRLRPAPVATSVATATTASFTPAANSLLVAVAVCGSSGTGIETCPVTDSLGSTWTLLKRANTNNFAGTAEIWVLDAGSSPAARTVTATITGSTGVGVALTVKVLTGANPPRPASAGSPSCTPRPPTASRSPRPPLIRWPSAGWSTRPAPVR